MVPWQLQQQQVQSRPLSSWDHEHPSGPDLSHRSHISGETVRPVRAGIPVEAPSVAAASRFG